MSRIAFGLFAAGSFVVISALSPWTRPPAAPPSVTQLQGLLPRGSLLHSLVRLEMDGAPPLETAVVAVVPAFPGAVESTYYGFVFGFDRWRRRFDRQYVEPLPGPIPLSPDAVPVSGAREAVIFGALLENGNRVTRVVESVRGRLSSLTDPRARQVVAEIPAAPSGATWRYRVRGGTISAQTGVVRVRPRQPVRLVASGGGPIPIVIPDARLDVLEQGYRARKDGVYTIRILLPFAPGQDTTLTIVVESP